MGSLPSEISRKRRELHSGTVHALSAAGRHEEARRFGTGTLVPAGMLQRFI